MTCYYPDGKKAPHQQWLRVWAEWSKKQGIPIDIWSISTGRFYCSVSIADGCFSVCTADSPVTAFCLATEKATRQAREGSV
jgi:hypothetical protein